MPWPARDDPEGPDAWARRFGSVGPLARRVRSWRSRRRAAPGPPAARPDARLARLARLTSIQGAFRAHVVAARLRSEGLDVTLRGAVTSPYALTVGDLARVDLYVPVDQLDDARLVMLASEVDATLAAPREWAGDDALPASRWPWFVALALLAVALGGPLLAWIATW